MVEVQATSESRSATCWNMLVQLDGAVYDLTNHLLNGLIDIFLYFDKENFLSTSFEYYGSSYFVQKPVSYCFQRTLGWFKQWKRFTPFSFCVWTICKIFIFLFTYLSPVILISNFLVSNFDTFFLLKKLLTE